MMRFCPKCGELYADQLLAFCLADGAPLFVVTPDSDVWKEGSRAFDQKQNALKTQQRKLKWRRVMLTAMLTATMVVSIAAVSRSISVTVDSPQGKLCITTFNDLNNNRELDSGEPFLSGCEFRVSGTDVDKPLMTEDGKVYLDLPIGAYTVVEQPRGGWIPTTSTTRKVTVTAGQTTDESFGSRQETELCIEKFNDLNGNGERDAGETGISEFVFRVSGTGAGTTLTTGANGFVCAVMSVGRYTVVEQPQIGWIATTPTMQTVSVTAGHAATVLFGSKQQGGKLCIKTFDDSNGNHVRDAGERGLSGFVFQVSATGAATPLTTDSDGTICSDMPVGKCTVVEQPRGGWSATTPTTQMITVTANQTATTLFGNRQQRGTLCIATFNDLNGDGVKNADEPSLPGFVFQVRATEPAKTLPTDTKGIGCSDLPIGNYIVVAQPQRGWIATTPATLTVTVTADQAANVFFGSRQERGKLCITAFDDSNGNHVREASEPGLPGFVFQVTGTGTATTLTTDSQGGICSELSAGKYTVVEQLQRSWSATTNTKLPVTVTAGQKTNVGFGSRQETRQERGTLCIATFNDRNATHKQDAGEPGLPGFVFQVTGTGTATTLTTDSQGVICAELSAGKYTVVEQLQGSWIATTNIEMKVTVAAGEKTNVVFGSRQEIRQERGTLCIAAFNDLNGNHTHEAGEPGLFGFVFHVSGTEAATTLQTGRNGIACADLPLGTYTVIEVPNPGWNATTPTKQTVILTSNRAAPLLFGNRKSNPDCSEADKSREWQIIRNRYESSWQQSIEGERKKIIAENVPRDSKARYEISLGRISTQPVFRSCTTVTVVLRYAWQIDFFAAGKKSVPRERSYLCEKTAGGWLCR